MVAGQPKAFAASATPCAWLPAEEAIALLRGEACNLDICAAHLEGAGILQILGLEVNLAVFVAQRLELHKARALGDALEALARFKDHAKCH